MTVDEVRAYHAALVQALESMPGVALVGVYAAGSYALGDYLPGRSDLDVAAVCARPLDPATKDRIGAALRHESLPCPARGLELVVYAAAAVREPTTEPAFELNLNTGREVSFRLDTAPDADAGTHWYAIDRAILHAHGVALAGPPADEVFAPLPRDDVVALLAESVRWHRRGGARGDDAVLNACRALRFAEEGVWSSKPAAGVWALRRVDDAELVDAARAARTSGETLDPARVAAFLDAAAARLSRSRGSAPPS